jgi:hypothetical protein
MKREGGCKKARVPITVLFPTLLYSFEGEKITGYELKTLTILLAAADFKETAP